MTDEMRDAIERLRNECNVPPSDPTDRVPNLTTDIRAVCDAAEAMVRLKEMLASCGAGRIALHNWRDAHSAEVIKVSGMHQYGLYEEVGRDEITAINAVYERYKKEQANAAG